MRIENKMDLKSDRFEAVAIIYMDSLYRSALYMTKNESDAQDLVQDTYMKAYRFFHHFREGTDCRAWLMTILRNTFINNIRSDRRRANDISLSRLEECDSELSDRRDAEDEIFRELLDDEVSQAMDALPDSYRKAVELADLKGFSYKEIARILGCPIGTIMSRLHRGRKILRIRLKNYAIQFGYGKLPDTNCSFG